MFMAAITKLLDYNFDSKIARMRMSRQEQLLQDTYWQMFHNDHDINQLTLTGDWWRLYEDNYTITEILLVVIEYYELEEDIELTICIQYVTHVGMNRTRTWDYVNMKELKINKSEQRKEYNDNSPLMMQNYSAIYHEEQW